MRYVLLASREKDSQVAMPRESPDKLRYVRICSPLNARVKWWEKINGQKIREEIFESEKESKTPGPREVCSRKAPEGIQGFLPFAPSGYSVSVLSSTISGSSTAHRIKGPL
jgi:hypothetical protein